MSLDFGSRAEARAPECHRGCRLKTVGGIWVFGPSGTRSTNCEPGLELWQLLPSCGSEAGMEGTAHRAPVAWGRSAVLLPPPDLELQSVKRLQRRVLSGCRQ